MKTLSNLSLCVMCLSFLFTQNAVAMSDSEAVQSCLAAWGKHPFAKNKTSADKVLRPSVKVLGIGGRDIDDNQTSSKPQLILIKPSVNVLSKSSFRLANPHGWYCLKSTVAVLGKAEFDVNCKARIASNSGDVAVLGKNENDDGGVAVLGSIRMKTFGDCK